ncbi:unnamed protein product [Symbiodinium sp. CCMP2592]|nr:unnamed protein product [Symbiodinium sp. CCMP2592]
MGPMGPMMPSFGKERRRRRRRSPSSSSERSRSRNRDRRRDRESRSAGARAAPQFPPPVPQLPAAAPGYEWRQVPVMPVQPPLPPPSTPAPVAATAPVPQQQATWSQQKQGQWNKRWNQWHRSSQGSGEAPWSGRQSAQPEPDCHNIQEATPSEVAAADARRAAKEAEQEEADDEAAYLASLWKSAQDEARADPTRPLSARELAEQGKLQWWWKMPWKAVVDKFPDTTGYKEFLEGLEGPIPASVISRVAAVLSAFRAYGRPLEGDNPVAGIVGPDAHIFRVPGQRILILTCELRGPSYIRNPNSEHSAIMAHGTSFPALIGVAEIGEIAVNDYRDQGIPCFGFSARGSLVGLSRDALESAATKCASRAKALGGAIILVECELLRSTPSVEGGNDMMQISCRDAGSAYRRVLTLLHAFSSFFDLCTLMADDEEDGQDSVQAVLAGKSPNTILKHLGPVRTFCEWILKASHTPPFPEKVLWSFIHCVLKMPKTAATTLDSSLRAIKWSYYTLGLRVLLEVFSSPRIHGVVTKALQSKNPWCPAAPLKVSEVLQLHAICCDHSVSVIDRCGAAHFLAMLYAGARASDIRAEAGLPNDQADVPLLPAPLPNGSWSSDPLSSSEITRWLRFLLPRPSSEQALSSHSLKVTSLVWCSKVVMRFMDANCSAALREYVVVLDAVATGKFLPDQTRSGHFASGWSRESILQAAAFPQESESTQATLEDDQDDALAVVSDVSDSDDNAPEEQSFWAHPTSQATAGTFDSREEAAELIEVFLPGINRDGKYQRADVLVAWAQENESVIKRQRRESLQGMWEVLPQQRVVPKLTDTFDELARSNPLVLLPALQRKRRLLRENTDATQRAKEEQLAKKKYALQLAEILEQAKLPLVQQLEGVDRPEEVWPRIFGTRRSKTLRNRLKAWEPFRTWLQCVHEVQWPTSVRQLIDYSNERFQSECGKTVLNSFQASLAVLEQVGKVAETQRLSSDTTWMAHLKSLTADLVGAQAPVQQAPMMTVAMIISLELHIAREDEPEYVRAMAFVALLAVYGSMRMDDLQGMLPATMRLTAQGFKATLGRTKTTGADRRNKEVVAGYVREVFKRLATPKFEDGAYRLNVQRYLLVEGAQGFFTGHSPRNWLTSAAAVLGWSKDQRDFLGRWMIGGSGSADYARTAREVVHRIQIGVCEAIVTGKGGEYQESEALEELKTFVDERGGSGALARRRHDLLRTVEGVRCLGNRWPAIEQDDADASEEDEAPEAMNVEGSATKYFISISRKTGHRRLHLNGPCHVKPHHCNRVEFVERVALEQIDSICRDCKHRMREDQGAEDDQDTSSESGSTSDSSSEEGQLRRSVGMFMIVSVSRISVNSMALPSEADQRAEVAKMDSDLQYVLQEASASLATQYQVARLHQSRRRFQAIADNREGARTAARDFGINPDTPAGRVEVAAIVAAWELAKEYASKEIELRAEAKVLGHKRILQVQERQAMLKAVTDAYGKMNESETPSAEYLATKAEECESNEPLASSLDRISSKKDSQVESLQTSIDPTGHVRVTKTMQKLEMPHHSEGYRLLMKVEAHAWLCMSARFKAKAWLQRLQLEDFTRFVEYILGDRVGNLKLPTASGQETQFNRPPWNIVLSYEYKLRVEAFKMNLEGTATMAEALRAVREDPSLKEAYFTTPLALHTAGTPSKFRKGNSKGKDKMQGQEIPLPPAPHQNGKKGKGQVVLSNGKQLALVSATPDGRQLCYAYNHQGCTDPKCARVHACRVAGCFREHPASQHEAATAGK